MTYIPVEVRRAVVARAGNYCEYCRVSQEDVFFRFEADHIISEKHGGETTSDNLCLSCPDCNAYKGSDIASADPETGKATFLFRPRHQIWSEHFRLNVAIIEPLTPEGRVTVFLLRLNRADRIADRAELIEFGRYPGASDK